MKDLLAIELAGRGGGGAVARLLAARASAAARRRRRCDEQKPAVSFFPQFFLLRNHLRALLPGAGATTLLFAKAKTLQEKTPEYISQH